MPPRPRRRRWSGSRSARTWSRGSTSTRSTTTARGGRCSTSWTASSATSSLARAAAPPHLRRGSRRAAPGRRGARPAAGARWPPTSASCLHRLGVVQWISLGAVPATVAAHAARAGDGDGLAARACCTPTRCAGPGGLLRVPSAALSALELEVTAAGMPARRLLRPGAAVRRRRLRRGQPRAARAPRPPSRRRARRSTISPTSRRASARATTRPPPPTRRRRR